MPPLLGFFALGTGELMVLVALGVVALVILVVLLVRKLGPPPP